MRASTFRSTQIRRKVSSRTAGALATAPRKLTRALACAACSPRPTRNSRSNVPPLPKGSAIMPRPSARHKEKADVGEWHQPGRRAPSASDPFEIALAPRIDQAGGPDGDEQHALQHGKEREAVVSDGPREEKDRFDVEDDEDQGEDVVLDFELDPGVADCFDAPFRRGGLFRVGSCA